MSEDDRSAGAEVDPAVVERLDKTLRHALDEAADPEVRFYLRQALQFVEIVWARDPGSDRYPTR